VVAGLELVQPTEVGVFHYEQSDHDTAKCALLSNHGTRVASSSSLLAIKNGIILGHFYRKNSLHIA